MTGRWDPFRDLLSLQQSMNRLLEDRLHRSPASEESLTGTTLPPVDIYENEDELVLEADAPGLQLSDIDIQVENNTLTIRSERKAPQSVDEAKFHRVERTYGSFARTFALPNTIDSEKIAADYNNGVLRVRMAKREESKPKQIRVAVQGGKQVTAGQAA